MNLPLSERALVVAWPHEDQSNALVIVHLSGGAPIKAPDDLSIDSEPSIVNWLVDNAGTKGTPLANYQGLMVLLPHDFARRSDWSEQLQTNGFRLLREPEFADLKNFGQVFGNKVNIRTSDVWVLLPEER